MLQTEATQRPPIILIANDYEWSGRSLETVLTPRGYAVIRALTGSQALRTAQTSPLDAIIVEDRLPDFGGVALCRRLRADGLITPSTPIIMTSSGRPTHEETLAAYGAGAWDVCHYPLDGEVLALRLGTFIAAKREADRARDDSLVDPMTGFYNIRGLVRRGREIAAEALRGSAPLACVAIAPRFTPPDSGRNERLDSESGSVPRATHLLGKALLRCVRASDVVGHLGRAEFAIIARNTTAEGAERLTRRMQASIDAERTSEDQTPGDLAIRASYFAVANYADTALDTLEMLERASVGLHAGWSGGDSALGDSSPRDQSPPAS